MFDVHATPEEDRLVVLWALHQLETCTEDQLMRFVVETGLQDQFRFLLALGALREAGLVEEAEKPEGRLLSVSGAGQESLEMFGGRIRPSQLEKLNAHTPEWRTRVLRELQMPVGFEETVNGFVVTLRALEAGVEIFSLKMTVMTREQARLCCERWPVCAASIYSTTLEKLADESRSTEETLEDAQEKAHR